jgi:hypothetical protein
VRSLSDGISSSVQAGRDGSLEVVLLLVLHGLLGFGLPLGFVVLFFSFRSDSADNRSASSSRPSIATCCAGITAPRAAPFRYVVVVIATFLTFILGAEAALFGS